MNKVIPLLAFSVLLLVPVGAQNAFAVTLLGPIGGSGLNGEYAQFSDSPFSSVDFSGGYFEFSDLPGLPNGVTPSSGGFTNGVFQLNVVDSVDGDDGTIDGANTLVGDTSWFTTSDDQVTWTFDEGVLGNLPTHAGIVWTDGANPITFEAFDQNGISLGTVGGNHADGSFAQNTQEDRFYGVINQGGISAIKLQNQGTPVIEMDHIQFGFVPEQNNNQAIGGEIIPIQTTSLLLASAQSFSWMIPVLLSGIGIGLFVFSRKTE